MKFQAANCIVGGFAATLAPSGNTPSRIFTAEDAENAEEEGMNLGVLRVLGGERNGTL